MKRPQKIQFPTALFKDVGPTQPLGGVHQRLLHARRVDVGVAYCPEEESYGTSDNGGSHTSAAEGSAAPVEGGASDARAVGDNVWLDPPVPSWQLLLHRTHGVIQ